MRKQNINTKSNWELPILSCILINTTYGELDEGTSEDPDFPSGSK